MSGYAKKLAFILKRAQVAICCLPVTLEMSAHLVGPLLFFSSHRYSMQSLKENIVEPTVITEPADGLPPFGAAKTGMTKCVSGYVLHRHVKG